MNKITVIILIALVAVSCLGLVVIYDDIPDKIPTQFGYDGSVSRYSDRSSVMVTGILPALVIVMYYVLPKIDPRRKNYDKHKKAYSITMIILVIVLIAFQWLSIGYAMGYGVNIPSLIRIGVGILLIVMGNYMSQFRQNYFIGIKTPWTLASEVVWKKTHRLGSYCFVLGGAFLIVTSFINNPLFAKIIFATLMIIVFVPVIYSYVLYKKLEEIK